MKKKNTDDMSYPYFPHTGDDIAGMLGRIGAKSLDDLYADVPSEVLYNGDYDLPDAMPEMEVRRYFDSLDRKNRRLTVFGGCGAYDHYSPAVIPALISRAEFLTAYTPYQAEISQGTLRYIFEFQTMMAELTGMDCANASMYDGATSAAEAMLMAKAATRKKNRVLVSGAMPDNVIEVVATYMKYHGVEMTVTPLDNGATDIAAIVKELQVGDVAGALVPGVNRYGIIEDLTGLADTVHGTKALLAVYSDPSALAVLKTPGEWGADIACGDAQTLGIPLNFGGPYVGFLACRKELVRKLPGRIVGATTDIDGRRAFVLTLQAREQHIRREKATSNICSNQSLMALYVTVYLSLMGKEGMKRVNDLSYGGAHYLHKQLLATGKFSEAFGGRPFLKEFTLRTPLPAGKLHAALADGGYLAAMPMGGDLVSFCVTEKRTREEIDSMVELIKKIEL